MPRRGLQLDAVANLETFEREIYVCGSVLTSQGVRTFWAGAEEDFIDALLSCKGIVWWHCDDRRRDSLRWWLDRIQDRGIRPEIQTKGRTGRLLKIQIPGAVHRDSHSVFPVDVEEFARGTDAEIPRPDEHCACRNHGCPGFCTIQPGNRGAKRARVAEWSGDVCRGVWAGLERLKERQKDWNIDGRATLASSAWHTVKRRYRLPDADPSKSRHKYARAAYYPGRTDAVSIRADRGLEYDLTMAYPAIYGSMPLPMGEPCQVFGDAASELARGTPGVYTATVTQPESFLPPLPWRNPRGRVGYPVGTFKGTWSNIELDYAVQCGVRIDKVHCAQVYPGEKVILKSFARDMYELRQVLKKEDHPLASYVKALAVSLVGAFGLSPHAEDIIFDPPPDQIKSCPCTGRGDWRCDCQGRCCIGCEGECGALTLISARHSIWSRRRWQILDRAHLIWAIPINAKTRTMLHAKAVEVDDGRDVIHTGTDGVLCGKPRTVGEGLGAWTHRRTLTGIQVFHGNTYHGTDEATGEILIRMAGEPRATAAQMLRDGFSSALAPVGLREGLAKGRTFQARRQTRRLTERTDDRGLRWCGSRIADGDLTRAPTVAELMSL